MRGLLRLSGLVALIAAFFILPLGAPALADTTDIIEEQHTPPNDEDGFQAGTCISDEPVKCSPETPGLWYEQAAGHPPIGFTQYFIRHAPFTALPSPPFPPGSVTAPIQEPILGRSIKTLRIDIPAGLTVNPEATPRCARADFERVLIVGGQPRRIPNCPDGSILGQEEVTLVTNTAGVEGLPKGFVVPPDPAKGTKVPLYNIVPEFGEPARFGFVIGFEKVIFLETEIAWESDYHGSFTIRPPEPTIPGFSTLKSRLVNFGQDAGNKKLAAPGSNVIVDDPTDPDGDGTYLTMPTTCFDPDTGVYSTFFRAESWEEPNPTFPNGSTPVEAALPEGVGVEGCEAVPFEPGLNVKPGTEQVDSPAGPEVTVTLPFKPDPKGLEQSHVRDASITLPEGMGLNPSAADNLVACTDEQFGKGTRNPVACPPDSRIGTAEVETPPLPPDSLNGDVYLGEQLSRNPESGEMYRIFVNPKSDRYGVDVRLIGNISANAQTGQLTATLPDNPQVPFESVTMKLDAAEETLTSPPTCGPNATTAALEPWARPGTFATPSSSFTLTSAPGGGSCPTSLAARPFDPGFSAGPTSRRAGKFTPFELHLTRSDGAQELRQVDVKLPPGMVAQLRNLDYCPEQRIDDAEQGSGGIETPTPPPPCPDKSFLGTSTVAAGSGPNPFVIHGNVYLAGPYKGAPVSLVFMTPAVAGPFDLGTVVVRVALNVDPETVQVTAVSDPIPYVFGGAKLGIRRVDVSIYRKPFTLNPTSCKKSAIAGEIAGGGANPNDPAAWSNVKRTSKFRATKCGALKFKPRFKARIFGGRQQAQRTANPKFRAILWGHYGDANVKRAAFILPRATILDQSHIRTICTRVQLEARKCPKASIYGYARARSPLLSDVVKGPVYLTSSKHELPDLLADLRGQIDVRLRGVISSANGRLKTVFPRVPDVPVRKFVLTMKGGKRGLLVNSENLCAKRRFGKLNLKAHNGKQKVNNRLRLRLDPCR